MGRITIKFLRNLDPETRLVIAVYLFWGSIVANVFCTLVVAKSPFEKILMAISWFAITLTAVDIIQTSDVRAEQKES